MKMDGLFIILGIYYTINKKHQFKVYGKYSGRTYNQVFFIFKLITILHGQAIHLDLAMLNMRN